jgi:methyl-accepting chemotaxis protein
MVRARISHKLLALGLGSVLGTAAVLFAVGAWQSDAFADRTATQVAKLTTDDLNRTSAEMDQLVTSVGDEVQAGVNRQMTTANAALESAGGAGQQRRTTTWTAINQVSQAKSTVTLPRFSVGGKWLGQNTDMDVRTPFIDDTAALTGLTVTVFQRMNDNGDLLRVATNVKSATGSRAIGTYIPAANADGTANAVAAAIKSGKGYRGVAQVVGTWFITAYDPIKDADGTVIGSLFVGMPQTTGLANLTDAITASEVRENGSVTVYSTNSADKGRIIASSIPNPPADTQLTATDARGTKYVEQIVTEATKLTGDATFRATYQLPGAAGAPAGATTTTVSFYKPYSWAIAVNGYDADTAGAADAVRDGRRDMLIAFLIAAVLLAIAGGAFAAWQARRIASRLGRLTATLTRLAQRDLTVRSTESGHDEIGRAGTALNTAVTELREVIVEVTGASHEVST